MFTIILASLLAGEVPASQPAGPLPQPMVIQIPANPANPRDQQAGDNSFTAIIHTSEEAQRLSKRTDEALQRQDWKLAIDSLQRMVELAGEHLVERDANSYESARRYAQRRIANLPAEALRAYRLLHEGEAAALLDEALEAHDVARLRSVVERYAITRAGGRGALILADWLMDEGSFAQAAATLQWIQGVFPDPDWPATLIPARLAVAMAAMGNRERAQQQLQLAATNSNDGIAERIAKFIASDLPVSRSVATEAWSTAGGQMSRRNEAASLSPDLELCDTRQLQDSPHARVAMAQLENHALSNRRLPTAQLVADRRVLVSCGGGELNAWDLASLQRLWNADLGQRYRKSEGDPAWVIMQQLQSPQPGDLPEDLLRRQTLVQALLYDTVSTQLTLADDRVYAIAWPTEVDDIFTRSFAGVFVGQDSRARPNQIAAYDLDAGRRLWSSDTAGGENAPGPVEFLCAPVAVGQELFAIARANNDLLGVWLEHVTGKLVRQVHLCGLGSGAFDAGYALIPCVADGIAYVPTGRGLVVAIDLAEGTIQWAARYPARPPRDRNNQPLVGGTWLASPMVAAGDSVLLAPLDADQLLCLNREDGQIRWQIPRQDAIYLLGMADRRVFVAGEQVRAIDLQRGQQLWASTCGTPTGRGVIAGERLYIPTARGLFALKAASGEQINLNAPTSLPLPGNLLAWNDSLFSMSLLELREFPDLHRATESAEHRRQQTPGDPSSIVRLARLQLVQDRPQAALELLDTIAEPKTRPAESAIDSARPSTILRTAAVLRLAEDEFTPVQRRIELLREAARIAPGFADRFRASIALARLLQQQGSVMAACEVLVPMVLGDGGTARQEQSASDKGRTHERGLNLVAVDEHLEQQAWLAAGLELMAAWKSLPHEQADELRERFERLLSGDAGSDEVLARLAALDLPNDLAARAALILGHRAAANWRVEQAEQHLTGAMGVAKTAAIQAEATASLAALYLLEGDLQLPVSAERLLSELEAKFPEVRLPGRIAQLSLDAVATSASGQMSARELAAVLRGRLDRARLTRNQAIIAGTAASTLAHPQVDSAPAASGPGREPIAASITQMRSARPLELHGSGGECMSDVQLLYDDERTLHAVALDGEQPLWSTELRTPDDWAVQQRTERALQMPNLQRGPGGRPGFAMTSGQSVLLHVDDRLYAVGALTGRRLWSIPLEPARNVPPNAGRTKALPIQNSPLADCMWVADGRFFAVNLDGELLGYDLAHPREPLWRRTRTDANWRVVRGQGDYVIAADAGLRHVEVFRAINGSEVGSCRFAQPEKVGRNLLLFDGLICGPARGGRLVAYELANPGVERWHIDLESVGGKLLKCSANIAAVVQDRKVQLIDAPAGQLLSGFSLPENLEQAEQVVIVGERAYFSGPQRVPVSGGTTRRVVLGALRVDGGELLWSKDLPPYTYLAPALLRQSGDVLPVASVVVTATAPPGPGEVISSGGAVQSGGQVEVRGGTMSVAPGSKLMPQVVLRMVDAATGEILASYAQDISSAQPAAIDQVRIGPGTARVFCGDVQVLFRTVGE